MSPIGQTCISQLEMVHALKRGVLAVAAIASVESALSAQEPLTFERAVQMAIAQNAGLRGTRAAVSEADAHVDAARAGWFPRVSVAETWQRGDQPVFVFSSLLAARQFGPQNFAIDALNHPDAIGFYRTSVALEQLIFDAGRQSAVDGATYRRDIAQSSSDEASAALMLATVQAYGRTLTVDAAQRAAEAALEAGREDLMRTTQRRDAGVASDADVLALVAHVADLQQRAIHHRGEAAVSRAELNRLMGVPIDREYQVAPPADANGLVLAETSVELLLAEAERGRPELRRAASGQQLADAERQSARAALIPRVAAQAAFDISGTQFNDRASAWLIGAEVRWNLSLGGAEAARLRAATDARSRAVAQAEDARAAVQVEVVTALRRLQAANARRSAGLAAVDQARESQRITRDRFEAGLATVTDVLRASSAVVEADSQRVSAVVDAMVSEATLRRALGRSP
jgi:outer membrane protein TolC